MALRQLALAEIVIVCCGLAFYPALWLRRRPRAVLLLVFLATIFLSPLLVPPGKRFLRLLAILSAVSVGVKLYDDFWNAEAGFRPALWLYILSLPNPFAIVLRRVLKERRPNWTCNLLGALVGLTAGSAAIFLLIQVFQIDWGRYPFAIEHCAKALSLFLIIQFLPNGLAAVLRLLGIPATRFGGTFFLARTPAEFWRLYNRPAGQFFHEYVFKPMNGPRRPVVATFMTFVVSGLIHEYVFDVPCGRILGTQIAFFLIQGLAAIATLRLRPRGWVAVPAIILTFTFNVITVRLFLASVDAVLPVPFYVTR